MRTLSPQRLQALMCLRNVRSPEAFGHPAVNCLDPLQAETFGVGFNSRIAGTVTAVEAIISEIPIFNIFIRRVLPPSQSQATPSWINANPKREDSGARQRVIPASFRGPIRQERPAQLRALLLAGGPLAEVHWCA